MKALEVGTSPKAAKKFGKEVLKEVDEMIDLIVPGYIPPKYASAADTVLVEDPEGIEVTSILQALGYESSMPVWLLVIIIVGGVIIIAAAVIITIMFLKNKRSKNSPQQMSGGGM